MTDTLRLSPTQLALQSARAKVDHAASLLTEAREIVQRDAGQRERFAPALDQYIRSLDTLGGAMTDQ